MDLTLLAPRDLDAATADQIADLVNTANKVDAPHLSPITGEMLRLRLLHGWDGIGTERVAVARDDHGGVVGFGELELTHWDNPQLAVVDVLVHPDRRRAGLGTAVLDAVVAHARAAGRTSLVADTWADSPGAAFARHHGMTQASVAAQRRLHLDRLDQPRLDELLAQAAAASRDYEPLRIAGAAPEHLLPSLAAVFDAINDAPLDDLSMERDEFPLDRLRGFDTAHAARRHRLYRLVARQRSDGAPAGHTIVVVEGLRPHLAFQEDTTVVREHRGHRLGLRLKLEMLRWLRDAEPQVRQIDTWNAVSNAHMIAVNDAMGHVVVATGATFQRRL
ncbi:MAG: GNAT family N-acetyltransferase [Actinomycetota bacterium]|nr:GNAT family N-acetyltransferase [Actinomycetota bacterium]